MFIDVGQSCKRQRQKPFFFLLLLLLLLLLLAIIDLYKPYKNVSHAKKQMHTLTYSNVSAKKENQKEHT